jgi:hypothetical protein
MSNSNKKPNKQDEIAADLLLIAGVQKHFATTTVTLNGTSYTGSALVTLLQARVNAINATIGTKASWQTAVKAQDAELAESQSVVNTLKKTIYAMFPDTASLADFGLAPHKKPVISPAERVEMAAKAKATRAARHTMGSQQKKAVTGSASGASVSGSSSSGASNPSPPAASTPTVTPPPAKV